MPSEPAGWQRKVPLPGAAFNPRKVFGAFGFGAFIPERVAASAAISMTAKVCYGHLLRRAGKNNTCWPSYRDVAQATGLDERQAMRGVKELDRAELVRTIHRTVANGRQTSNEYEFIWGPILQGEDDTSDTLPPPQPDRGRVTGTAPTRVSEMTPLEVKKINHHQGRDTKRSSAREESRIRGYSAPEPDRSSSTKADDAKSAVGSEYASGKDELKAIYLAKTGESFPVADLDAIEAMLVGVGVTWEIFVADIRGHAWDRITNPIGFLRNRAKKFRALTRGASRPVTAAEAAVKNYRCQVCSSTVPGEGARRIDGKTVPCACASPEYVARQRARGVFPEEPS